MKMKSILPVLLAIPLALASCGKKADPTPPAGADKDKAAGADAYPLTTCVVSGETLGDMGKPVEYDYKGTMVKFCCKSCIPDFQKEPEKYLAKLKK